MTEDERVRVGLGAAEGRRDVNAVDAVGTGFGSGSTPTSTYEVADGWARVDPIKVEEDGLAPAGYLLTPRDKNKPDGWAVSAAGASISPRAYLDAAKIGTPPKVKLHSKLQAGRVNWFGVKGVVLSWDHGHRDRYGMDEWDAVFPDPANTYNPAGTAQPGIYYKGTKIDTPVPVWAAAVRGSWLVFIYNDTLYRTASPLGRIDTALKNGKTLPVVTPTWDAVAVTGAKASSRRASAWHFSPDGSKAACAVVLDSYGVGTWSVGRACTEALPQSKLYMLLSLASNGALTAAWGEATFVGEPWGTAVAGYALPMRSYTSEAVPPFLDGTLWPITYSGKRLVGVDFDAAGAEIEVTIRRTGSGEVSSLTTVPGPAPGREYVEDHAVHVSVGWGVYAGEQLIVETRNVVPTLTWHVAHTSASGSDVATTTFAKVGEGSLQVERMSVLDLDARFGAACIERVNVSFAALTHVHFTDYFTPYGHSAETAASTIRTEWVFGGAKVAEQAVPTPPGIALSYRAVLNPNLFGGAVVVTPSSAPPSPLLVSSLGICCAGADLRVEGTSFAVSQVVVDAVSFPETSRRKGESLFEDRAAIAGYPGSVLRTNVSHFDGFPNQVTGFLVSSAGPVVVDYFGTRNIYFGLFGFVNVFYGSTFMNGLRYTYATDAYYTAGGSFGRPKRVGNHYVMTAKNSYSWGFYDMAYRIRGDTDGTAYPATFFPTCAAAVFVRPDGASPYVARDLIGPVADQVDADISPAHRPSFRLDPVRTL